MSYKNSNADKHRKAIIERLGAEQADPNDFWGFTAFGARVVYHHACDGDRCDGRYPQYRWEKPFDIEGLDVDYVLLEAPSTADFFLIPTSTVKDFNLPAMFHDDFNIAADPHRFIGPKKNARAEIWKRKMTFEQVKEELVDFEWTWSLDF